MGLDRLGKKDGPGSVVKIIFPDLGPAAIQVHHDQNCRRPVGPFCFLQEPHSGLFRRFPRFFMIAPPAGRDDILPVLGAAPCRRNHVVKRQVVLVESFSAVLARKRVSGKEKRVQNW